MGKAAKPPIVMRKGRSGLYPANSWAQRQLDELPFDKDLNVRVTQARTHSTLNLWWAGLQLMVDNLPDEKRKMWPTARKMHNALLEAMGFVDKLWRIDGTYRIEIDSVSFDEMGEEEFREVFELGRSLCIEIAGYDPFDAWQAEAQVKQSMRR